MPRCVPPAMPRAGRLREATSLSKRLLKQVNDHVAKQHKRSIVEKAAEHLGDDVRAAGIGESRGDPYTTRVHRCTFAHSRRTTSNPFVLGTVPLACVLTCLVSGCSSVSSPRFRGSIQGLFGSGEHYSV